MYLSLNYLYFVAFQGIIYVINYIPPHHLSIEISCNAKFKYDFKEAIRQKLVDLFGDTSYGSYIKTHLFKHVAQIIKC